MVSWEVGRSPTSGNKCDVVFSCKFNCINGLVTLVTIENHWDRIGSWWFYTSNEVFQISDKQPTIQPLGDGIPTAPAGQCFISKLFMFLRLYMNIGGTYTPTVFMPHTTVVVQPFSALTTLPTCFAPRRAIILPGVCTVVIPDSSMLYTWFAPNFIFSSSPLSTSKNCPTCILLNPASRDILVASGQRKLSSG